MKYFGQGRNQDFARWLRAVSIAKERGGELLSESIPRNTFRARWRCAKRHEWETSFQSVLKGTWCPVCSNVPYIYLTDLQAFAASKGGKCLSTEYHGARENLLWECAEGHRWSARIYSAKSIWCPHCSGRAPRTIDEVRSWATERGGKLLSTYMANMDDPLDWQCAKGHVWKASASSIRGKGYSPGTWCPHCPVDLSNRPKRITIEMLRQAATERGGECLSNTLNHSKDLLLWRCKVGHVWRATALNVRGGAWCPTCAGVEPWTLDRARKLARARGGTFLGESVLGVVVPVPWQCKAGHVWRANINSIQQGKWCPKCAGKQRLTLEEFQEIARSRGGECLSESYVRSGDPLQWRCAKGHTWFAPGNRIKPYGRKKIGAWCPKCTPRGGKLDLEEMREIARKRGGLCLSDSYKNVREPLLWRCASGHEFVESPRNVRGYVGASPRWCPYCAAAGASVR